LIDIVKFAWCQLHLWWEYVYRRWIM